VTLILCGLFAALIGAKIKNMETSAAQNERLSFAGGNPKLRNNLLLEATVRRIHFIRCQCPVCGSVCQ
jgi:hypothetical protein